jgi:peptide chain release factor 1
MKVLRSRLLDMKRQEEEQARAATRRGQISTGDRSAKIRTYNFPQSRVTDHRINLTMHRLPEILEGDLGAVIDALTDADMTEKLKSTVAAE